MKTRKLDKLRNKNNGSKGLPRLVGKRWLEFKISPIQMDDLCLTRIRTAVSSSECL